MSAPETMPAAARPRTDKRRAANLLRDYYGLSGSASGQRAGPSEPIPKVDLKELLQKHSLSELLAKESSLITEIRELDGERQSLVYNHHHELVAASDTIRNMKLKSESLDPSLDALKTAFGSMSDLSSGLEALRQSDSKPDHPPEHIDILRDLEPVVTLPTTLSDLIETRLDPSDEGITTGEVEQLAKKQQGLAQAEKTWGLMEPVLAAWTDAGVPGVREIAAECRSILKEGRKNVSSLSTL